MGTDNHFDAIIKELSDIHKEYPDLRFGLVLQTAIDQKKRGKNFDFHNLTSKELLQSLKDFKNKTSTIRIKHAKKEKVLQNAEIYLKKD